jgi:UPF0716 family protein affecting phage T7 exclusion
MAIIVIGGLITSTLLSLLVIPVVFTYVDDLLQGLRHMVRKDTGTPEQKPVVSEPEPGLQTITKG